MVFLFRLPSCAPVFVVTTKQKHVELNISKRMLNLSLLTWFVCYSRREEESLLGSSSCCQGPLVMWKNWDHERRHVTLNLLNRREPMIRQSKCRPHRFVFHFEWCAGIQTATVSSLTPNLYPMIIQAQFTKFLPWDSICPVEYNQGPPCKFASSMPACHYIIVNGFLLSWLFSLFSFYLFLSRKLEEIHCFL